MCALSNWCASFAETQLFAAIIGALIGIVPAHLLTAWHERRTGRKDYVSWLNGLFAELKHIEACVNEISDIVQSGTPSTKRMNEDFLEESRLKFFAFDKDLAFLESLTNAYRDIVHTNAMLDRFEKMAPNHAPFQPNVQASMKGVGSSISCLKCKVEQRLKT